MLAKFNRLINRRKSVKVIKFEKIDGNVEGDIC